MCVLEGGGGGRNDKRVACKINKWINGSLIGRSFACLFFWIWIATTVNYFRRSGRGNYQTPSVAAKTSEMAHLRTSKE